MNVIFGGFITLPEVGPPIKIRFFNSSHLIFKETVFEIPWFLYLNDNIFALLVTIVCLTSIANCPFLEPFSILTLYSFAFLNVCVWVTLKLFNSTSPFHLKLSLALNSTLIV